jgi:SNF2 family DNA or RNA helicase
MQGYLGRAAHFQTEYEIPITHAGSTEAAAKLRRRIDPFTIRRTKAEVAKDLPPLSVQVLSLPMVPRQEELYLKLLRDEAPELINKLKEDGRNTTAVFAKLMRLRQVAAHPRLVDPTQPRDGSSGKFDAFVELLGDALEEGHKVLVFSQWAQMAAIIREHLETLREQGIRHVYLDGRVPAASRPSIVAAFQETDGPQVMVLSLLAGGEGITLSEADVVVLYDRWWNPAVEEQAIARAHRIGQKSPVTALILEAKNTIEERLAELLSRKKSLAEAIITVDAAEKRISREDLLQLLQDELAAAERRATE